MDAEQALNAELLKGQRVQLASKKPGRFKQAYSTVGHLKHVRASKQSLAKRARQARLDTNEVLNRSIRVANLIENNSRNVSFINSF